MEKFKGTKGKWVACCMGTLPHFIFDHNLNVTICAPYQKQEMSIDLTDEQFKANALLISKAPEMLEMLQKMINEFDAEHATQYGFELCHKAKQLIKEATELT